MSPPPSREIDNLQAISPRPVEMQVPCLGLSRTGTKSMYTWQDRTALRHGFDRHYTHIRSIVPNDNLLEYRPQQAWETVCEFLGKPVPEEPFPRANEGGNAARIVWVAVVIRVLELVIRPAAGMLVAWAAWYYALRLRS